MRLSLALLVLLPGILAALPAARAQPKTIEVKYTKDGKILRTVTKGAPPAPEKQRMRSIDARELATLVKAKAGRATLLVLYAAHCPACRVFMPTVARLEKRWRRRGLSVLALGLDEDEEDLRRYLTKANLSFKWLHIRPYRKGELKRELTELGLTMEGDTFGIPLHALFDRKLRLVRQRVGASSYGALDRRIRSLLGVR